MRYLIRFNEEKKKTIVVVCLREDKKKWWKMNEKYFILNSCDRSIKNFNLDFIVRKNSMKNTYIHFAYWAQFCWRICPCLLCVV